MNSPYLTEFLSVALVHLLAVVSPGPDFAVAVRQAVQHGRQAGLISAVGFGLGMLVHVVYTLIGLAALLRTVPAAMRAAQLVGAAYLAWLAIHFMRSAPPAGDPLDADETADPSTGPASPGYSHRPYQQAPSSRSVQSPALATQPAQFIQSDRSAQSQPAARSEHCSQSEQSTRSVHTQSTRQAFLTGFFTNATNPKATMFFLAVFTTLVSPQTPLEIQTLYGLWMCVATSIWFAIVAVLFSHEPVRRRFLAHGYWFERIMGAFLLAFALKLVFF